MIEEIIIDYLKGYFPDISFVSGWQDEQSDSKSVYVVEVSKSQNGDIKDVWQSDVILTFFDFEGSSKIEELIKSCEYPFIYNIDITGSERSLESGTLKNEINLSAIYESKPKIT